MRRGRPSRPVEAWTSDGKRKVGKFASVTKAQEMTGIWSTQIHNSLSWHALTKGKYLWLDAQNPEEQDFWNPEAEDMQTAEQEYMADLKKGLVFLLEEEILLAGWLISYPGGRAFIKKMDELLADAKKKAETGTYSELSALACGMSFALQEYGLCTRIAYAVKYKNEQGIIDAMRTLYDWRVFEHCRLPEMRNICKSLTNTILCHPNCISDAVEAFATPSARAENQRLLNLAREWFEREAEFDEDGGLLFIADEYEGAVHV